ncbi:MAG TPA: glycosyltransferase family 4 protein [Burkholderiales bacterium]|nr:glycosyltransferase family 4 protein [Burkholderiales bacterium]
MSAAASARVLHVLPHPGGGGEAYVERLAGLRGYRMDRVFLAETPDERRLAVAGAALRASWHARRYDLVHLHGEVVAALCLPAMLARPAVVTLHGLHLLRRSIGAQRLAATAGLRATACLARRMICVSLEELAEASALLGPSARSRLAYIPNGVPVGDPPSAVERRRARAALGIGEEATVGVFVGALEAYKDPATAVRAALQVRREGIPLVLLLAGEGSLRSELSRLSAAAPDGLRLLGHRSDVTDVLSAADFFVLPSLREGLAFALLEAMHAGLAPVVSDAPGNVEAVGESGIVVRRGSVERFAEAFRLLATDSSRRATLGAAARARVVTSYSLEGMLASTARVYDDALSRAAGAARPERSWKRRAGRRG